MDDHLIALELGDEITVGEFITALKDVWFSEQSIR